MVLRESEYQEDASLEHVLRTLAQTDLDDDERKTEFRDLTEILMMYDCR